MITINRQFGIGAGIMSEQYLSKATGVRVRLEHFQVSSNIKHTHTQSNAIVTTLYFSTLKWDWFVEWKSFQN